MLGSCLLPVLALLVPSAAGIQEASMDDAREKTEEGEVSRYCQTTGPGPELPRAARWPGKGIFMSLSLIPPLGCYPSP